MGKGTNSFDYRTFASYLLPKDILKFFEVTDIEEEHTGQLDQTGTEIVILRISLDELDNREQLGLDLRPNGFTEGCDVTDFPIRDHKVVLRIRRRAGGWTPTGTMLCSTTMSLLQQAPVTPRSLLMS